MAEATAEATVERLLETARARLLEIERTYRAVGRSVADVGIEEIAQRMAAAIPAPSPVNAVIGPFYRTDQVVRLLGLTRQAVFDRVARRTLLAMKTRDGSWVYPVFQFEGREVLPGLAEALRPFRQAGVDGWGVAAWLASPDAALDGMSPVDCIREGRHLDRVECLARDARVRWTR